MRTSMFQTALCLMLAVFTTNSSVAGVRGRPMNLKSHTRVSNCLLQSDSGDTVADVNPIPMTIPVVAQPMMSMYRSSVEAGMYHFPYDSYRRPWYFPGQPSFQRSTDCVW